MTRFSFQGTLHDLRTTFSRLSSHDARHSMPATNTITSTKRPTGIPRVAARPRLRATGGDVRAHVLGSGVIAGDALRPMLADTPCDRGGKSGNAVIEGQKVEYRRTTSFNADVSLGAPPG